MSRIFKRDPAFVFSLVVLVLVYIAWAGWRLGFWGVFPK
jgi:hypothetical protein